MSLIAKLAVKRIAKMHPKQGPSTVTFLDASTQVYTSTYVYPIGGVSGLGNESATFQNATICLHQIAGETAVYEGCTITIADGSVFNVGAVATSLNFATGGSVFTCTCTRKE